MNIKKKCQQIDSLLGDLSSTGIKPIPDIVLEIRMLLDKMEDADEDCACTLPKLLWKETSGWYCGICYKPARQ
jgi:hypothetical protein